MLEKLQDYFLGKDISNFYNERIEKHSEKSGSLKLERDVSILYGKVLPNLLTLAGISTALGGDIVSGGFIIGGSEAWRKSAKEEFQFKKVHYVAEDYCELWDKIIQNK